MTNTPRFSPPEPRWQVWLSSAALGLGVAFALKQLLGMLVVVLDTVALVPVEAANGMMYGILALMLLGFGLATVLFSRQTGVLRRLESALIWAGAILLATLVLMLAVVVYVQYADPGAAGEHAAAAFFLLLIFGGFYGILGGIFCVIGVVMRHNRRRPQA